MKKVLPGKRYSLRTDAQLPTPTAHRRNVHSDEIEHFSESYMFFKSTIGEISSDLDHSSLCDIEKSSFKSFEIGLKMILPTQVHTQRITKTLLGHLPDL